MNILVTGGAGFIGCNFIRYMLNKYPNYKIVNLDNLTYAGNLENLRDIEDNENYSFIQGDICDSNLVARLMNENSINTIINFAAETHVDKSQTTGYSNNFFRTNIFGVIVLLERALDNKIERFLHISTDEVYGSIEQGSFKEDSILNPTSPYSQSKAAADDIVLDYREKLPIIITRSSNNFGPYQYPEKFIPLIITNVLEGKKIPLYGDGLNVRDWIYIEDNCEAIDFVLHNGKIGEIYNIGARNGFENISIAKKVLSSMGKSEEFIEFVKDRPSHDKRYSIDIKKIIELGWKPRNDFESTLEKTINWYINNTNWWRKIKSGEHFKQWYNMFYVEERGLK